MPTSVEPIAITEQTTPEFRDDLNRLSIEDRTRVQESLRRTYELLRTDRRGFFAKAKQPAAIHLKGGFTSSLYSVPAGRELRLIMAVDHDPVFAQTLITLFRAVHQDELSKAYGSIAKFLYKNQIERNGGRP